MPEDRLYALSTIDERIDVADFYDMRYWSNRLGVAKWRIREAVLAVGDNADAVQDYLARGTRHASRRVVRLGPHLYLR